MPLDKIVSFEFVREDGETLATSTTNAGNCRVYAVEGLTGLDYEFNTRPSYQSPNYTVHSSRPLTREITLDFLSSLPFRQRINGFFNPTMGGKLRVDWGGTRRWIEYLPYPVKIEQPTIHQMLKVRVRLNCPNPYWRDVDDYGKNIALRVPLLAFPFVCLADRGVIADYRLYGVEVPIQNGGDIPVGARVVFQALGKVVNPRITLNHNEYFAIELIMIRGDELIFDSDIDNTLVTLNGENVENQTEPGMTFFQVPRGDSVISFDAEAGRDNMNVTLYFTPQYVGV
ncbi:MAG: phage tail family protein [Clostridiales bacterium]|jgi:hypothetical protein|nr:phage tail family protein [Clostridiales bacterium]